MALFDVIKYEGDNSTIVWKHPREDFNMFTQLIVHENQEAVFYMNGQALDMFGPGRYTLKTQNIPLIGKFLNIATGGISAFHCEVYFVNKTEQMSIKWGTDSRVQFMEPSYKFPLSVGACGEMSIKAIDSRRLLINLVGTESGLTQQKMNGYLRSFIITKVKSYIASVIKSENISIFEIDERLADFSAALKSALVSDFCDYGISLERFFVTKVMKPDGEPQYEKFKELHFRQYADIAEAKIRQQTEIINAETEAQKTVIDSKAQATKRVQEGYTYGQERGFDVAEKVADNEASGEFVNMGIGFGAMAGIGSAIGGMVGNIASDAVNSAYKPADKIPDDDLPEVNSNECQKQNFSNDGSANSKNEDFEDDIKGNAASDCFCENCGAPIFPDSKFCEECGEPVIHNDICKNCGYKFERKGKFCPKCGAKRG